MFKNYLKSAFRNLWKHKLYSGINIGGLSIGLAVAVLILLYVKNELSYDNWIPDQEQLYRVYRYWPESGGGTMWTPDPLAEQLTADFPEITEGTGLFSSGETLLEYENTKFYVEDVAMVDSTFFNVIALPFKQGLQENALRGPNAVVISERVATLFFGSDDPIGKTLRFNDDRNLVVTGVLHPLQQTHLPYEIFIRFTWGNPNWNANNRTTYIKVNGKTDTDALAEKITEHVNNFKIEEWQGLNVKPSTAELPDWRLQAISDVHLHSADIGSFTRGGDIKYVYIFGIIALIVLLIGAINYINLSTARALGRAREVGVRKVTGARKTQLIAQFLMETVTQAVIALLIAVFLVELFLPGFNQIVDRELAFLRGDWISWIVPMFLLSIAVGLLAGIYPAFVMSSFQPVKVLKSLNKGKGGNAFRRTLVVTQFSLSVVLVIVMLFIYKQINFMMGQDLGFQGDQVVVIPFNADDGFQKFKGMEEEFRNLPGVINVTAASRMPGSRYPDWSLEIQGQENLTYPRVLFTDENYLDVLELEMVDGRYFSTEFPGDTARRYVVNEAFLREYQIDDPFTAKIKFSGEEEFSSIIGVVKDYHYRSLDNRIRPLIIGMAHNDGNYAGIQLSAANLSSSLNAIEQLWAKVEPVHPIRYSFLDEDFGSLYEEYRRFGKALLYATFLAVFIAILGLFGLATYATITRTKEIGVRKVLGATVEQLSFMLVSSFVKWVLLAGLIAIPVGYFISNRWLEDFAYRTELSVVPFVLAIGFAIFIAALTVSFQAIWSASRNPVEALRYE